LAQHGSLLTIQASLLISCIACNIAVSYLEELEKKFHEDPQSIDRTWASFFANLGVQHEAGDCQ
jgi:2-oxoglutarate dehydrogenase complex dehydrogenase (E1) component-like enzyme